MDISFLFRSLRVCVGLVSERVTCLRIILLVLRRLLSAIVDYGRAVIISIIRQRFFRGVCAEATGVALFFTTIKEAKVYMCW